MVQIQDNMPPDPQKAEAGQDAAVKKITLLVTSNGEILTSWSSIHHPAQAMNR